LPKNVKKLLKLNKTEVMISLATWLATSLTKMEMCNKQQSRRDLQLREKTSPTKRKPQIPASLMLQA
jgi:hypothetical protein